MPRIILKFDAAIIKEMDLTKDTITFGRKDDNDLVVNHPAVSGHHGKFVKEGDGYIVEDIGSTNGTFVNGRKIKKSKLENKDTVRIAKHIVEYLTDSAPAKPKEAPKPAETKPQQPAPQSTDSKPVEAPAQGNAKADDPAKIEAQKEILRKSLGLSGEKGKGPNNLTSKPPLSISEPKPKVKGDSATIKVVSGGVGGQSEIPLAGLVTYIGASDQAVIKIKGFLAPSLAAAISRRPEGYFLKAVKAGYPKVNGNPVNQQTLLESGALIECGGTNMVFYLSNDKKKVEESPK